MAAHREDHPHHSLVRPWIDGLLAGLSTFGVPGFIWASFIRISTNRRIFEVPTPVDEAFAFMSSLRAQSRHRAAVPGPGHLEVFERLCREADAAGDLAADAYLAAVAVDLGCELVSLDRDFARFADLRWRRPGD